MTRRQKRDEWKGPPKSLKVLWALEKKALSPEYHANPRAIRMVEAIFYSGMIHLAAEIMWVYYQDDFGKFESYMSGMIKETRAYLDKHLKSKKKLVRKAKQR